MPRPAASGAGARASQARKSVGTGGRESRFCALSLPGDAGCHEVENLVGNAIKFGPPGCQVEVTTSARDTHVTLAVSDTGPGLGSIDRERLFVRGARLSNRPTGGESSTGLGLAWCKQLVELHGGRIGADNREPSGAVFWFELPARR